MGNCKGKYADVQRDILLENAKKIKDVPESFNYPIGTKLKLSTMRVDRNAYSKGAGKIGAPRRERIAGKVVANYPFFFNLEIKGKLGNYVRSINKVDFICGDSEILEVYK